MHFPYICFWDWWCHDITDLGKFWSCHPTDYSYNMCRVWKILKNFFSGVMSVHWGVPSYWPHKLHHKYIQHNASSSFRSVLNFLQCCFPLLKTWSVHTLLLRCFISDNQCHLLLVADIRDAVKNYGVILVSLDSQNNFFLNSFSYDINQFILDVFLQIMIIYLFWIFHMYLCIIGTNFSSKWHLKRCHYVVWQCIYQTHRMANFILSTPAWWPYVTPKIDTSGMPYLYFFL